MTALRSTLSRALISDASFNASSGLSRPADEMLGLPERAVQFGTGAFLRGFVDASVDQANANGTFNGRIVAIGSTSSGRDRALARQDGLYTLVSRGIVDGTPREERRVIGSISRALSASHEWNAVLACARNPQLGFIFSNTTEVGITFDADDEFDAAPPLSFPGKLTRFLYERAVTFAFAPSKGVIVVPCELIEANGARLRAIVLQVAETWQLEPGFTRWIEGSVQFCNTLVDRIVPGAPSGDDGEALARTLGYSDELLTTAEHFRQFVIEGDEAFRQRLEFAGSDASIIVAPDIEPYRQRKIRLLNGAHSISVALALLTGCTTVRDAMVHPRVGPFIRRTLLDDIVPTLNVPDAEAFARSVLERFENPYIQHALFDITLHGTTKFRVRIVPTMLRAAERLGRVPDSLALGFAAHLLLSRGDLQQKRRDAGLSVPVDELAEHIRAAWPASADGDSLRAFVERVSRDELLWGTDLTALPRFVDAVTRQLNGLVSVGADETLDSLLTASVA